MNLTQVILLEVTQSRIYSWDDSDNVLGEFYGISDSDLVLSFILDSACRGVGLS